MSKRWPAAELGALFALEEDRMMVLPVLHGVDLKDVKQRSPLLADRLAMKTGADTVDTAQELFNAMESYGLRPVIPQRFRLLLNVASVQDANSFLKQNPRIVAGACRLKNGDVSKDLDVLGFRLDFGVFEIELSTGRRKWEFVVLDSPKSNIIEDGSLVSTTSHIVTKLIQLQRDVGMKLDEARRSIPGIEPEFSVSVVVGRRGDLSDADRHILLTENRQLYGIRVRTYDWLLNAAVDLENK